MIYRLDVKNNELITQGDTYHNFSNFETDFGDGLRLVTSHGLMRDFYAYYLTNIIYAETRYESEIELDESYFGNENEWSFNYLERKTDNTYNWDNHVLWSFWKIKTNQIKNQINIKFPDNDKDLFVLFLEDYSDINNNIKRIKIYIAATFYEEKLYSDWVKSKLEKK
jgi:hypothetical protein